MKEKEIRPVILCSKKVGLLIKIKSGGRDYEGISYRSEYPFVMLDLSNLNKIKIDLNGGGLGPLIRKFGLAADNVVDARVMDVNENILDREMNEDLFWAIRGGGGASFGVILRWKLKLVRVPEKLTVFTIRRKLEGNHNLLQKWENISHQLPEDLFIRAAVQNGSSSAGNITKKHVQFYFQAQYLGPVDELIPLLKQYFPEFNLERNDCFQENTTADAEKECQEVPWIRSA
ncbi:putative shikimate O-hydroxycinnamoyltransferase-like [Capsicum annuum]|nr:putative shikimate O-hydroxycinnamoyltransferase-like [Capsicum annuum]KAF3629928.1 putative shikimate O-hydroxycinnamoyltransferase-like [Capsicum annuum]